MASDAVRDRAPDVWYVKNLRDGITHLFHRGVMEAFLWSACGLSHTERQRDWTGDLGPNATITCLHCMREM